MPETLSLPRQPMPHVFVLSTGRCGSMTFGAACGHITNYTSAHESRVALVGPERTLYPSGHIEVDNRLSWFLGRLEQSYGDNAYYVHLRRDQEATARSYVARWWPGSLVHIYGKGIYLYQPKNVDRLALARDLVTTVNANIEQFLSRKSHVMTVTVETATTDFAAFWQWIGAEGDLTAALAEWRISHNATRPHPRSTPPSLVSSCRTRLAQSAGKVSRVLRGLPEFIRSA